MDKTSGYVRTVVAFHNLKDKYKDAVESLQEKGVAERVKEGWDKTREDVQTKTRNFITHPDDPICDYIPPQYSYIFRPKSRLELVLLSGTVCGIEFCYAAETAFVTPILLNLGLKIKFVTMIWCLSPLIGFFLTPVLGSLSDSCESIYGRRRPFIMLLSTGILLGLILVPNGRHIGAALGDTRNLRVNVSDSELKSDSSVLLKNMTQSLERTNRLLTADSKRNLVTNMTGYSRHNDKYLNLLANLLDHQSQIEKNTSSPVYLSRKKRMVGKGNVQSAKNVPRKHSPPHMQPWSIAFTVIGTILLDFCSDACQSPSRTYLLDVSLHEDHNAGLSTFTVMAGLGGSIGYLTGAIHWESTYLGTWMGGQINTVFMLVTIVFLMCLISTLRSFPELPLPLLRDPKILQEYQQKLRIGEFQEKGDELAVMDNKLLNYGTTSANGEFSQAAEPTPNGIVNDGSDIPQAQTYEEDDKSSKSHFFNFLYNLSDDP